MTKKDVHNIEELQKYLKTIELFYQKRYELAQVECCIMLNPTAAMVPSLKKYWGFSNKSLLDKKFQLQYEINSLERNLIDFEVAALSAD